jgi:hypothetical protein
MIRAVDLAVTVGAASVEEEDRSWRPRANRVLYRHVTLSTEPGVRDLEQPVIDSSMRLVANRTIFKRRWMGPEKRPAPLGVTGVTVFIDAGLLELGRVRRAVGIMAVRTDELSFPERHMGRAVELRLPLRVTLAANFYFRTLVKERSFLTNFCQLIPIGGFLHQGMAINAS